MPETRNGAPRRPAREPVFARTIKLIYIAPPFNIGNPNPHYDDGTDREAWLAMMEPRLQVLRRFLRPDDGVIFVHIDHRRLAELKLLLDRIFGADASHMRRIAGSRACGESWLLIRIMARTLDFSGVARHLA